MKEVKDTRETTLEWFSLFTAEKFDRTSLLISNVHPVSLCVGVHGRYSVCIFLRVKKKVHLVCKLSIMLSKTNMCKKKKEHV